MPSRRALTSWRMEYLTTARPQFQSSISTIAEPRNTATTVVNRNAYSGALIQSSRSSTEGIPRISFSNASQSSFVPEHQPIRRKSRRTAPPGSMSFILSGGAGSPAADFNAAANQSGIVSQLYFGSILSRAPRPILNSNIRLTKPFDTSSFVMARMNLPSVDAPNNAKAGPWTGFISFPTFAVPNHSISGDQPQRLCRILGISATLPVWPLVEILFSHAPSFVNDD